MNVLARLSDSVVANPHDTQVDFNRKLNCKVVRISPTIYLSQTRT